MHEQFKIAKNIDQAFGQLVEELGEATSAAGKTLRFGPYSGNILLPIEEREFNIDWLLRELDDVDFASKQLREFLSKSAAEIPPKWVRPI